MTEETAPFTCQRCERSYLAEGDEEDRCPFCNASQHDCDFCPDSGGETCISCGQWVCSGCWAGHDDEDGQACERGRPDWKEPGAAPPPREHEWNGDYCEECGASRDGDDTAAPAVCPRRHEEARDA